MVFQIFENVYWWQLVLIGVGVIAIAAFILSLFFTIGDDTESRVASESFPAGSEEFLKAVAHIAGAPLAIGGDVEILNNGDGFLPSLLKAIKEAGQSINFTVYIWKDGEMSGRIIKALEERAAAGVEIRMLLDGFGSILMPLSKFDRLKGLGAKIEVFRPPRFGKFTRVHKRNHRRAIVVDGRVGFTGGMAVADHWLGNAEDPDHWRDLMFKVTGSMAQSLQTAFADLWAGTCGEILAGPKFYPDLPAGQQNLPSRYVGIASSPAPETQLLPKLYWMSFASARRSIDLASSYVVPDWHIRKVLCERARAGVKVRLLVPNNLTDAKPIRLASHFYFDEFLRSGIRIFEYEQTMMHAKYAVVDGEWAVIGSANMDFRSMDLNQENVFGILNPGFAGELERVFAQDLSKAEEITLDKWRKRGLLHKLGELVCVNFIKQY